MPAEDILQILPLIITGASIVLIVLLIALVRSHILTLAVSLVSLSVSLAAAIIFYRPKAIQVSQLLVVDAYARFYLILIYSAALIVCAQSYAYVKQKKTIKEEYYVLLLSAVLGSVVLACSIHLASLFIGIELLSLSLYVLISYTGTEKNIEAGIKYLIPTAVAMTFLLFGMALIYASTKTLGFEGLSGSTGSGGPLPLMFLMGAGMFLVGLLFKLAIVPFHFWIPDVFEGSPAPVTGFLATVSKGAVFAVLARSFSALDIINHSSLFYIFAGTAAASMFLGNVTALMQTSVKRILGYSSIAHFGYLLLTLIVGGATGVAASIFYLTAYFATTLTAFGVITFLSGGKDDMDAIEDFRGMAFAHPVFALCLTAALLSLAGIPLTAGFIAKFYIVSAGAKMKLWALLVILIINSVIGLFYYLRVAAALYGRAPQEEAEGQPALETVCSWIGRAALAVPLVSLFILGIWPGPLVQWILELTNLSL